MSERFVKMYRQGNTLTSSKTEVIVDTVTGVNYLLWQNGYAGGLTPLLDKDGKPIVTPLTPDYHQ